MGDLEWRHYVHYRWGSYASLIALSAKVNFVGMGGTGGNQFQSPGATATLNLIPPNGGTGTGTLGTPVSQGTVTVTTGSPTVTGAGTSWSANTMAPSSGVGEMVLPDGNTYAHQLRQ